MTPQDYTAPEWHIRISRKERFRQVFEVYQTDGVTPDTSLPDWSFAGELFNQTGQKLLTLTSGNGISQPAPYAVMVELTTTQMNGLKVGPYRLEIYGTQAGERENLVTILLTVE